MIRFRAMAFGLAIIGMISVPSSNVFAYTGEKLAKGAKVSIEQARAIAASESRSDHRRRIGTREGRQRPSLSFDIKSDGAVYEVGVDAQTGKVLEDKKEGRHPD
jgi:uncharacterized membrane protein YkoI